MVQRLTMVNLTRFFLAFSTLGWELFMKIMKSNLKFHLKNHETSPPTKLLSERMPTLKYPNAVSQLSANSLEMPTLESPIAVYGVKCQQL